jgi:hypothetical protein
MSDNMIEHFQNQDLATTPYPTAPVTINDLVVTKYFNLLPPGSVIMWNGTTGNIPEGWVLCDGQNGTPDLTDRFIFGGNQYVQKEITLNVTGSTNSTGSHSHSVSDAAKKFTYSVDNVGGSPSGKKSGIKDGSSTSSAGAHTHKVTVNTTQAGSTVSTLTPKWASLIFIKKI